MGLALLFKYLIFSYLLDKLSTVILETCLIYIFGITATITVTFFIIRKALSNAIFSPLLIEILKKKKFTKDSFEKKTINLNC